MHTYGLTCAQSIKICFYMMVLDANFTMRGVASSANSYANYHYDIYQDTFSTCQYLRHTVSIGFHGFILIFFQSP